MSNALNNFLSLNLDELLNWIDKSYQINISGGFGEKVRKDMLEQELLYWIEYNGNEDIVWNYLDKI